MGAITPLFIFGMPRSGTKLLRDLLNNHDLISIPTHETHFIPLLLNKFGLINYLDKQSIFEIEKLIKNSNFYFYQQSDNYPELPKHFYSRFIGQPIQVLLKELLKHYSKKKGDNIIWGDKTPEHINHVVLLNQYFQGAKLLHIVRDPRDYALSMNKAWGKNIYLASHKWNKSIMELRKEIYFNNIENIFEIKYEDLIENPSETITKVLAFLNLSYQSNILDLQLPSENLGDTKGSMIIEKGNAKKYFSKLLESDIKKIEEITYLGLVKYNYPVMFGKKFKDIPEILKIWYYIKDVYHRQLFNISEYGLLNGIKFSWVSFKSKYNIFFNR